MDLNPEKRDQSELLLSLIGPMRVQVNARPVELQSRKARALLAYLALRRGVTVPRDTLCALLWGDRGEEQARASLRQTLSVIRKDLSAAAGLIEGRGDHVSLSSHDTWCDVDHLMTLDEGAATADLLEIARTCRGEFLEGLNLNEPPFDHWLVVEREAVRSRLVKVLGWLAERLEKDGRFEEAVEQCTRLVALDVLNENAHRKLMFLFMAQGRHEAAHNQYALIKSELRKQLGVEPAQETQQLVSRIKANRQSSDRTGDAVAASAVDMQRDKLVRHHQGEKPSDLSFSGKPSLAVLPFTNLSGDVQQEYFADGMTEDIITALSRIPELFVISRQSSFVYKGRAARSEEVATDLGVRFLLEGGVRVAGNRVRVTAQLIDGQTGGHLWAETFDQAVDDIFSVQDEITRRIVLALQVKLNHGEAAHVMEWRTKSLRAWEKMSIGRGHFARSNVIDTHIARAHFIDALQIDPNYTGSMTMLAHTYWWDARFDPTADKEKSLSIAEEYAERALAVDSGFSLAFTAKGMIEFMREAHGESTALCQKAVELAPSNAWSWGCLGLTCIYAGEVERAITALKTAIRLSPQPATWYTYHLAQACMWNGDSDEATALAEAYLRMEPDDPFAYTIWRWFTLIKNAKLMRRK